MVLLGRTVLPKGGRGGVRRSLSQRSEVSHYILAWEGKRTLMGGPSRRMTHLSGKRQHLPPGLIVGAFNKETRGGAAGPET